MPRKPRNWIPTYFYHIVCRGNRRDPLFMDDQDARVFFKIVDQVYERNPFEISAYCLMTNHYHLLIRSQDVPISKIIGLINKRYANYYNTRYCVTGHVFEKRFFDKLMANAEDLLEVSKYIHLNPVKAHITLLPHQYQWSSFSLYQSQANHKPTALPRYITLTPILSLFPGNLHDQAHSYTVDFHSTISDK